MGLNTNTSVLSGPFFRGLKLHSSDHEALSSVRLAERRYAPHTGITHQGMTDERAFIIQSGWGCVYKDLPDGERQVLDFVLAGDVIGIHPMGGEAQHAFVSITELYVIEANARAVVAAMTRSQPMAQALLSIAWRQNNIMAEHLVNLGRRSALARTAHLLLELGERLKVAGQADNQGYDCPLTQYDLADALGLTAIHINRMLRELREYGLLSLRRNRVEFLDYAGLVELAQFDGKYLEYWELKDLG